LRLGKLQTGKVKLSEALAEHDVTEKKLNRLAISIQMIQSLNDDLHGPGGALHASSLQVIGFDKTGNLLLCQRDEQGKVDGKYLVDCHTGKVVGRTKPGAIYEVWERTDEDGVAGKRLTGGDSSSA
jgi:hypothetical protein